MYYPPSYDKEPYRYSGLYHKVLNRVSSRIMAISEPHENVDKAMHMRDTGRAIIAQRSELSLNYRYTELKDKKCLN